MQRLQFLIFSGVLSIATGFLAAASSQPSASSQTPTLQYKIAWHGAKNTALIAAYTVFEEDGTATSKAFNGQFPKEVELTASPTATVTASGTSPTDTHIRVRIYQNGKICDESISYGKGNYATASCSPSATQGN